MEKIFFKLIRATWKHYDRVYSVGEHRYDGTMDPKAYNDGLYYSHISDLPRWTRLYDDIKYVCPVELYDDSVIIQQRYKYKTNHFKLLDPIPIEDFLKAHYSGLYLVECHPENIKYVTEETIVNDVKTHLFYDKRISTLVYGNKSAESDLPAFRILRNLIREEIHSTAVKKDGLVIDFIERPSLTVQIEAIRQNWMSIKFIKGDGTYDIWIEAIKQNGMALACVKEKYRTEKLCLAAVSVSGMALEFAVNQTYDMCMIAVKENGYALQFVKRKYPEMCIAAWRQNNNVKLYIPPDIYKEIEPKLILPNGKQLREIIIN